MNTGGTETQVRGKAVIIHDYSGARIGCAIIGSPTNVPAPGQALRLDAAGGAGIGAGSGFLVGLLFGIVGTIGGLILRKKMMDKKGKPPNKFDNMIDNMVHPKGGGAGGAPGAGAGAGAGGPPPGAIQVQLSEEDRAAVTRLTELGFDRAEAIQAYMACEKNEEMAANFLFENGE